MKEHTLHFLLACLLAILIYAVLVMEGKASEQEGLKFPTKNVREMWYACSIEFRKLMPICRRVHEFTCVTATQIT